MLLLFIACSEPSKLEGNVIDIFGNPVPKAEVFLEGIDTPQLTENDGDFSFSLENIPSGKLRFRSVSENHMTGRGSFDYNVETYSKTQPTAPQVQIQMYPSVEEHGFFIVQDKAYQKLHRGDFEVKKTEIQSYHGIKNIGNSKVQSQNPYVIFHTSVRREEIQQLDLNLNKLEFKEQVLFKTITGDQLVDIDLWLPTEKQNFSLSAMGQKDTYKIEFTDVEPGIYAFHTNGLLDTSSSHQNLPKELQRAYIFEIESK